MTSADALLTEARQRLHRRNFDGARGTLQEAFSLASTRPAALSAEQHLWLRQHLHILSPLWYQPVSHGVVALRRCCREDEAFFRKTFEDRSFVQQFNRQRPWSGDLGRALHKFGQEPPALLRMLQWVVCLRDEPVGLISLSHLDLTNARAEFSIGFPTDMSAGISHKACLLAMHFAFFMAGLNKLYGYVYEGNGHALQSALRIGFKQEGFLADHFRFPPDDFVGVHVVGLTRRQALESTGLVKAVARRTGHNWASAEFAIGGSALQYQLARGPRGQHNSGYQG